jgi:hypothetical protein
MSKVDCVSEIPSFYVSGIPVFEVKANNDEQENKPYWHFGVRTEEEVIAILDKIITDKPDDWEPNLIYRNLMRLNDKQRTKFWGMVHKEAYAARNKKWREANAETLKAKAKAWREANAEKLKLKEKARYEAKKQKEKEQKEQKEKELSQRLRQTVLKSYPSGYIESDDETI